MRGVLRKRAIQTKAALRIFSRIKSQQSRLSEGFKKRTSNIERPTSNKPQLMTNNQMKPMSFGFLNHQSTIINPRKFHAKLSAIFP